MNETKTNYNQQAAAIITASGGKNNIHTAVHCMTRLRLTLLQPELADQIAMRKIDGVLGVIETAGQIQIVLGPGIVNQVTAAVNSLLQAVPVLEKAEPTELRQNSTTFINDLNKEKNLLLNGQNLKAAITAKNRTPLKLFLRRLGSIFTPLIPAIVASGMIAGLTNIAIRAGADPQNTFILLLNAIGWGLFAYLGIFVGINTAKEFGGTPVMGGLAGVLLLNPAIAQIQLNGQYLVPGRGGIAGVLLVACLMCWLEKQLRRFVPPAIDIIVTPTLTLLIAGFATYYILQPLGGFFSDLIIFFFKSVIYTGGPLAGFLLAGTFLPVIMSGLHQGLTPIHMEFLNTLRENPLLPILAMAGAGQVGAAAAVYLKTNNRRLKQIIKAAFPVGLLGIGEPLIFGVTLPLGRPFITACIGAACGGAWQAMTHVCAIGMGISGLPLAFLIQADSLLNYLLGLFIAYSAGFLATWLAGFDDLPDDSIVKELQT